MPFDIFKKSATATLPSVKVVTQPEPEPEEDQSQAQAESTSGEAQTELAAPTGSPPAADLTALETVEFLAEAAPDGIVLLLIPGALREREERMAELDREILTIKRRLKELYKKRDDIMLPGQHQAHQQKGEAA